MAEKDKIKSDGIFDFTGGMDSYSSPSLLAGNQYSASVNCQIRPGKAGISTRPGYRGVKLKFVSKKEEESFKSGRIQGCGYYIYLGLIFQLVSCEGKLLEFKEINKQEFEVRHTGLTNNPNNRRAYFTNVPQGAIVNDAESSPIIARDASYSRVSDRNGIKAGRAGKYIQNRFFYISADAKSIQASTINNSISLEEQQLNNLFGFLTPDDTDIVAIGEQKSISKDTSGGSLVFSTENNMYSVDVSGPMSTWSNINVPTGKIGGDLYDVAAVSPFSFLSLNGNVYFRSTSLGIGSLQYLQYVWNNVDITEPQSRGGHLFFENDDNYLLDSCYSVKFKNSIYTTVAPNLQDGSVYWSGMLVTTPGQKGIIRYDSLYTGIQPWCMQTIKDKNTEYLYIFSKDYDGENRMYMVDHNIDYDLTVDKKKVPIESKIITRMFNFNDPFLLKKTFTQLYSMHVESNPLKVCIKTRHAENNNFKGISEQTFKSPQFLLTPDGFQNTVPTSRFVNANYSDGYGGDNSFYECQDFLTLTGSFRLIKLLRAVELSQPPKDTAQSDDKVPYVPYSAEKFYTHKLY